MLSIQQVKKILKRPDMSDEEAEALRDGFRTLAEFVFEQWQRDRKAGRLDKNGRIICQSQPEWKRRRTDPVWLFGQNIFPGIRGFLTLKAQYQCIIPYIIAYKRSDIMIRTGLFHITTDYWLKIGLNIY